MASRQNAPQPTEATTDDRELIRRIKAGDHQAFETLFTRHLPRVYRQAIRLVGNEAEAEEVAQDVFVAVYKKAHTFRGQAAFSTWLYRLTANAAITRLRKRKRSKETTLDEYLPKFRDDGEHLEPVVDWSQDVDSAVARAEVQRLIQQALDELPPLDKAAVVLSDQEELSNRDIAKALGLTVPAVKARLHRSRLILRGRLAAYFERPRKL
jgi:RNA polymerase sigma-70 factor (ECF subfamily)